MVLEVSQSTQIPSYLEAGNTYTFSCSYHLLQYFQVKMAISNQQKLHTVATNVKEHDVYIDRDKIGDIKNLRDYFLYAQLLTF